MRLPALSLLLVLPALAEGRGKEERILRSWEAASPAERRGMRATLAEVEAAHRFTDARPILVPFEGRLWAVERLFLDVLEPARLLVTDLVADPRSLGGATGTLFTLEPDADSLSVLLSASTLRRPYRSVRQPNGNLLILDLLATNPTGRAG
ncbi:MAG: hypothetical protein HC813_02700, partial [Planctomycetes bacterium]|nr:hypothetical protein [Planctomycetota bacterium]